MPNACVQAVGDLRKSSPDNAQLFTQDTLSWVDKWTNDPFTALPVHNFCIQLYTPNKSQNTGVHKNFSPLSTSLIINTVYKKKENILVGNGG